MCTESLARTADRTECAAASVLTDGLDVHAIVSIPHDLNPHVHRQGQGLTPGGPGPGASLSAPCCPPQGDMAHRTRGHSSSAGEPLFERADCRPSGSLPSASTACRWQGLRRQHKGIRLLEDAAWSKAKLHVATVEPGLA